LTAAYAVSWRKDADPNANSAHRGSVSYDRVSRPRVFSENKGQRSRFLHPNLVS